MGIAKVTVLTIKILAATLVLKNSQYAAPPFQCALAYYDRAKPWHSPMAPWTLRSIRFSFQYG